MATRTQTELQADISGNVKSAGNPSKTTAANLRTVFINLVDTVFATFGKVKTVNNTAPDDTGNVTLTVSGTLDDTVTQTGTNGVKSSGIWSFVYGLTGTLSTLTTTAKGTLVAAINELKTLLDGKANMEPAISTGGVIKFDKERTYGTVSAPITDSFTIDTTGARVGMIQELIHNAPSEPTYPTTMTKYSNSGNYMASVNNYYLIELVALSPLTVKYTVMQ